MVLSLLVSKAALWANQIWKEDGNNVKNCCCLQNITPVILICRWLFVSNVIQKVFFTEETNWIVVIWTRLIILIDGRDHTLSTCAKFSEKLTFLTPW